MHAPKKPSESAAEFQHLVLPPDINALGSLFGGRLMEWVDIDASIVALRHARQQVVTASIDALNFVSPIYLGSFVILKVSVNYTHRTSMEIGVRIESENPLTGQRLHTASAYLTFVAVDKGGKPLEIPPLICETDEDKRRYDQGKQRREDRLKWRK